jgi:hypothetical protein
LNKEALVIALILKHTSCRDLQGRILAIKLLPLVKHTSQLRNSVFSLTLDRHSIVRYTVIRALKETAFDQRTIDALLRNVVQGKVDEVRIAAVEVLTFLARHLITSKLPQMIAVNGFVDFIRRCWNLLSYDQMKRL